MTLINYPEQMHSSQNSIASSTSHVCDAELQSLASANTNTAKTTPTTVSDYGAKNEQHTESTSDVADGHRLSNATSTVKDRHQTPDAIAGLATMADTKGSPTHDPGHSSLKRTLNGQMKTSLSSPQTRMRVGSTGSTNSRASEIAAQLRTNLTYAMTKVQHGWEHQNIAEVERLAAKLVTPRTAAARTADSVRTSQNRDRTESNIRAEDRRDMRHCGASRSTMSTSPSYSSQSIIPAGRGDRTLASPPRMTTVPGSCPATPDRYPRGSTRNLEQTAQAEQDAMDALLLMGSPNRNPSQPNTQSSMDNVSDGTNSQDIIPATAAVHRPPAVSRTSGQPQDLKHPVAQDLTQRSGLSTRNATAYQDPVKREMHPQSGIVTR